MPLWDGGAAAAEAERAALRPFVLTPACDVPADRMPKAAAGLLRKAHALDCAALRVRSSYAAALVPGVLRGGDRVTVLRESVAVRLRGPGGRGFAVWLSEDGGVRWDPGDRQFEIIGRGFVVPAMVRGRTMAADAYLIDEALHDLCSGAEVGAGSDDGYVPTRRGERPTLAGVPRNRWAATGTPLGEFYPCRCHEPYWRPGFYCGPPRNGPQCPCWGRDEVFSVPSTCCSLRRLAA